MKRKNKNYSAFSFVEVMMVIAIIGIMTGVGLVSMSSSKNKRQLEAEARKVAASIREAQVGALTGKVLASGQYPCAYSFQNTDDSSYILQYSYRISGDTCSTVGKLASFSLEKGIKFKNYSPRVLFYFTVPFGTVSFGAAGNIIILKKGSYCANVSVDSSGNVTEGQVYTAGC